MSVTTGAAFQVIHAVRGKLAQALLLSKQVSRIETQGAAYRASYRKHAGDQHRKYDSDKYKRVPC